MRIYNEINLSEFNPWGGAKETVRTLEALEDVSTRYIFDELESAIEELYGDNLSETELNDFLWFENDEIAAMLGYYDWEELEAVAYGEEEEEEEEEE